jgi:hypothetical protein
LLLYFFGWKKFVSGWVVGLALRMLNSCFVRGFRRPQDGPRYVAGMVLEGDLLVGRLSPVGLRQLQAAWENELGHYETDSFVAAL